MSDVVIINLNLFRRDVHFLYSMFCADEKVAELPKLGKFAGTRFADEVNRQLLLVAVSARNILDATFTSIEKKCGLHWDNIKSQRPGKQMGLKKACHSIVHALQINSRVDGDDSEDTIETNGKWDDKDTRALLKVSKFVESCMELCDKVAESYPKELSEEWGY